MLYKGWRMFQVIDAFAHSCWYVCGHTCIRLAVMGWNTRNLAGLAGNVE